MNHQAIDISHMVIHSNFLNFSLISWFIQDRTFFLAFVMVHDLFYRSKTSLSPAWRLGLRCGKKTHYIFPISATVLFFSVMYMIHNYNSLSYYNNYNNLKMFIKLVLIIQPLSFNTLSSILLEHEDQIIRN